MEDTNANYQNISDFYLEDGSYMRIKNITLGYTFPKAWINRLNLASARVYVNVLNPFTFTDYIGWDPEFGATSLQNGNGPSTITYQFGLNLKF